MMLPRLRLLAGLAGERDTLADPLQLAELREDYRYLAAVCRNVLPHLEADLSILPTPLPEVAPPVLHVAYQMALMRCTNRLYRAVLAAVEDRRGARAEASSVD